jgi:hypothetical protein
MQGVLRSLAQRSRTALNMPASSHSVPHRGKKKKAGRAAAKGASSDAEDVDVDLSPYRDSMRMTVDALQRDLASIRTSGAHPSLLDSASPAARRCRALCMRTEAHAGSLALHGPAQSRVAC